MVGMVTIKSIERLYIMEQLNRSNVSGRQILFLVIGLFIIPVPIDAVYLCQRGSLYSAGRIHIFV